VLFSLGLRRLFSLRFLITSEKNNIRSENNLSHSECKCCSHSECGDCSHYVFSVAMRKTTLVVRTISVTRSASVVLTRSASVLYEYTRRTTSEKIRTTMRLVSLVVRLIS
jgi:hypothetical protein